MRQLTARIFCFVLVPRCAALLLISWLLATTLQAQTPLQTPLQTQSPPRESDTETAPVPVQNQPTLQEIRTQLETQLNEATTQRRQWAEGNFVAPPSITAEDKAERRTELNKLIFVTERQLNAFGELDQARRDRKIAEQQARSWTGFADPPPYSILRLDELREQNELSQIKLEGLRSWQQQLQREALRYEEDTQDAQAALRRANETLAQAATSDQISRLTWFRDLAQWEARTASTNLIAFTVIGPRLVNEQLATVDAKLALLKRQIAQASTNVRFSEADLEQVQAWTDGTIEQLDQELQAALTEGHQRSGTQAELVQELERVRATESGLSADVQDLEARLRVAEAQAESSRAKIDHLNTLIALNRATNEFWRHRYVAFNSSSPDQRRASLARLQQAFTDAQALQAFLQDQASLIRAEEREQTNRLGKAGYPVEEFSAEQDVLAAYRDTAASVERLRENVDHTVRMLARWLDEFHVAHQAQPLSARLTDHWATVVGWSGQLWRYEVFTVEDTITLEGQQITTTRGVTVGQCIKAVLFFLVGYWLSGVIARRMERTLINRFQVEENQAKVLRRWLLVINSLILLLVTLNLARIPLTAFAFLGGALAIGIGFGTQTIFKNLISGVIVLTERKVRVGDIVQVDGVLGTVTSVDLRSTTVLGFDGIENLIPNAALLENKVINWTLSDARQRRVIKVGVAYGSPPRTVVDILTECAERHGLVLDDPAPLVLFDEFGDNALIFKLYFWIEFGPKVNALQVASDLRLMIEKRLAEARIVIAFPQRDVHLDTTRPLQIEWVPPNSGQ